MPCQRSQRRRPADAGGRFAFYGLISTEDNQDPARELVTRRVRGATSWSFGGAATNCAGTGLGLVFQRASEAVSQYVWAARRGRAGGRRRVAALSEQGSAAVRVVSGGVAVFVDQAAEHVDPFHSRRCSRPSHHGQRAGRSRRLQVKAAVWPGGVVML